MTTRSLTAGLVGVCAAVALVVAPVVHGASVEVVAPGLLDGGTEGGATVSTNDGHTVLSFPGRSSPQVYQIATALADESVAAGAFAGDYAAAGAKSLSFTIMTGGQLPLGGINLVLNATDGLVWQNNNMDLMKSTNQAGVWTPNLVPFTRGAGWDTDGLDEGQKDYYWSEALRGV